MRFKDFMKDAFVFEADIGRGRRSRKSMFGRGDLKFVILQLIADKPMHGYEVMTALEDECRGFYRPSPGSVYPTLQMLEDQGYVKGEELDGKKVYSITPEGTAFLGENEDHVEDIFGRFDQFTGRFGKEMRELSRSFSHLARETFESAFKWTEDSGFINEMKDILDEAQEKMAEARASARASHRKARRGGDADSDDHADDGEATEPDASARKQKDAKADEEGAGS